MLRSAAKKEYGGTTGGGVAKRERMALSNISVHQTANTTKIAKHHHQSIAAKSHHASYHHHHHHHASTTTTSSALTTTLSGVGIKKVTSVTADAAKAAISDAQAVLRGSSEADVPSSSSSSVAGLVERSGIVGGGEKEGVQKRATRVTRVTRGAVVAAKGAAAVRAANAASAAAAAAAAEVGKADGFGKENVDPVATRGRTKKEVGAGVATRGVRGGASATSATAVKKDEEVKAAVASMAVESNIHHNHRGDNYIKNVFDDEVDQVAAIEAEVPAAVAAAVAAEEDAVTIKANAVVEIEAEAVKNKTVTAVSATVSTVVEVDDDDTVGAGAHIWDDLDAEDAGDPMMVSEYVVEIFDYMKELEISTLPNPDYMSSQQELDWNMRAILVDWMIEVHHKFRLLPETLYLSVNIIDRFLSLRVVSLVKLQLVGIVAMFIAAKYEEIVAPSVKNFIYMSDDGYTEDEILKAERHVLSVLEFNLRYPSPMSFLRRVSKAEQYDVQTRTLAKYLMEISLMDQRFIGYVPSLVAAAGLYLARKMLRRGGWDANLCHYSSYTESEVLPTVQAMLNYLDEPCKHAALYKKYSSKKFMKCSVFARDWFDKHHGGGNGGGSV